VQFQVDPFFRKRSKDRSKALGSKAITTKEDEPLVRHQYPPLPLPWPPSSPRFAIQLEAPAR